MLRIVFLLVSVHFLKFCSFIHSPNLSCKLDLQPVEMVELSIQSEEHRSVPGLQQTILAALDVPRKWLELKESGFWNKSHPLRLTTSTFPLQHSLCLTFSQIPCLISARSSMCAAHFTAQGPNYIFQLCSRLPQSKIKPNNVHFLATTLGPLGSSP